MQTFLNKLIYKTPWYVLVLLTIGISLLSNGILYFIYGPQENPVIEEMSTFGMIFSGLIGAPLVETFVFQFCIIQLVLLICRKSDKNWKYVVAIFLSAIAFGFNHCFSLAYFIDTFIVGIAFASYYLIFRIRKNKIVAFFMTALVHSLLNAIPTVFDIICLVIDE